VDRNRDSFGWVGSWEEQTRDHTSHLGFLCPVETPEGPACGLIKAFSMGTRITYVEKDQQAIVRTMCIDALPEFRSPAATTCYVFLAGPQPSR